MKDSIELTILMPCLNESETLEICINKAKEYAEKSKTITEILVADNGSTDGSQEIALKCGAKVVNAEERGYGAALREGITHAKGKYIIMGDADDSYDFSSLQPYMDSLRSGNDLVMGNRFRGGISNGAMPILHRFIGNPVLSFLGRVFFNISCKDFHCGLRGFKKDSIVDLGLNTTGMEFASEMIVKSALNKLKIDEVPTTLSVDGRTRSPHLNTWTDGWRHLCFLLLHTPKWLFLYPSMIMFFFGLIITITLLFQPVELNNIQFSNNTFYAGCLFLIVGFQCLSTGVLVRNYAAIKGLLPPHKYKIIDKITLEKGALTSLSLISAGSILLMVCVAKWVLVGFGDIESQALSRGMVLSMTLIASGFQSFFTMFVWGIMKTPKNQQFSNN
ncbi:dolichol-P-glucose synthetase [Vibrio inusitatus NBRC 102082]|uniref:Dolichol-P-glucose synthetase n=1 Tax=Vibrio inusitatus NBRC 102082 TaxID=1219070 RepID=A0A4Y3I1T5_9VIBR|nr:glycosyltransferase family 2 protein [Vibrio inusitatus]GEA52424.1 dolichol-P-glucose synthetase [Vibrio inusitatus NBRC 102082]